MEQVTKGVELSALERKKARQRPTLMPTEAMERVASECHAYFSARADERAASARRL